MNGNGSINYNKTIAKEYGMYAAILLGVLCYKYDYWIEKGQLTEDGYFFVTQEDIEEETGLSEYMQREALKKLGGIVSVSKRDMPKKNYYKIDYDLLLKVLTSCCEKYEHKRLKSLTSSDEKFEQQEVKDFNTTNKEITNKITNKDITNNVAKNDEYDTHHPIDESNDVSHRNGNYNEPPSVEQVRSYAIMKGFGKNPNFENINWEDFINYYEANDWKEKDGSPVIWRRKVKYWVENQKESVKNNKLPGSVIRKKANIMG